MRSGHDGTTGQFVVPKWNEEPSTLDAFEERVILYVLGTKREERYLCGPRLLAQMDPERQPYKVVKSAGTTTQLAAEGGGTLVIAALRRALGARPIQEAVRLFRHLVGLRDMRRQPGECESGLHALRQGRHSIRQTQKSTRQLAYIP